MENNIYKFFTNDLYDVKNINDNEYTIKTIYTFDKNISFYNNNSLTILLKE
jgi:hypothetical protein